jgi:enoyl-CoA hydratase/carnithine racemase
MSEPDILVHHEAGVTTITFNRVDKKNSFTEAMYGAMAEVLNAAAEEASVRCVVFQGDVTVFSAGNDIGDFLRQGGETQPAPFTDRAVWRFLNDIATFPKPLVAAVCGPAVGVGTTLLLHCDLVYAGDNAAFALPFVNLGLCPEAASSLLLPKMLGMHRAAEALMLGEPFMAEAALEVGLVNRVVPPTECNAVAQAQARKLAAKPLSALMQTKRLMKGAQTQEVLARMQEEAGAFSRLMRSPAAKEAFSAFMQKRKPDFSGM